MYKITRLKKEKRIQQYINYIFYNQEVNAMAEMIKIPIEEKVTLTLGEAASYSGI